MQHTMVYVPLQNVWTLQNCDKTDHRLV